MVFWGPNSIVRVYGPSGIPCRKDLDKLLGTIVSFSLRSKYTNRYAGACLYEYVGVHVMNIIVRTYPHAYVCMYVCMYVSIYI